MQPHPKMQPIPNTQRRVVWTATAIALALVGCAVLSVNLIASEARYAGAVLFGFGAVCAIVTAVVYVPRAREFHRLLHGEPPLVDWQYGEAEWQRYVQESYRRYKSGNWGLWLLTAAICGVVGVGLAWVSGDTLFLLITAGIAAFLLLPATLVPLARRRRLARGQPRAVVNRHAAWIGGQFQTWGQLGSHLVWAEIDGKVQPPLLCITFRFYAQTGPQDETVLIPIPAGQEAAAQEAVAAFRPDLA